MPASTGSPIKPEAKKFLPLAPSGLPVPEGPGGYRLQRAGERGYVVISGFVQAAFGVTGEGVVLVDAPPALDGKIQAAIASVTDQQVTHLIYTHSHADHVGAVTKFPGPRRIAHEEARAAAGQPRRPGPPAARPGHRPAAHRADDRRGGHATVLTLPQPRSPHT